MAYKYIYNDVFMTQSRVQRYVELNRVDETSFDLGNSN